MKILSLNEAAARAGIVRRTLERQIATGEGPAVVAISARRRGILEADLELWLLSRRRPAPGTADSPAPLKRGPGRPRKLAPALGVGA